MEDGRTPPDELLLYVCVTCRKAGEPDGDIRPGALLHEALSQAVEADGEMARAIRVEPVECLSGCKRGCTIAVSGPGRWTYVYGDLDPSTSVDSILDGVRRYGGTANGLVPWRERPEAFRKGVIARIPPFSPTSLDKTS